MPHEAIGAEYHGVVYLRAAEWAGEDGVERDALLVHELTHVASAALVLGGPLSLIEGVARYEEQRYVANAGAALAVPATSPPRTSAATRRCSGGGGRSATGW